jgi:hypothetical protein
MEIVTKKNAYWGNVPVPPNMRFTVPEKIGDALISRGMAEDITEVTKAASKKTKKSE